MGQDLEVGLCLLAISDVVCEIHERISQIAPEHIKNITAHHSQRNLDEFLERSYYD